MGLLDLGDLSWSIVTSGTNTYFRTSSLQIIKVVDNVTNYLCENYEAVAPMTRGDAGSNLANGQVSISNGSTSTNQIMIRDDNYSTTEDFKTAVTGVKIAYELVTPTTETITPTNLPIKSLSGYSHIESTTGEMEVEYITEEYQPLVDLIQSSQHVYATTEQVVGKWVDGSDVFEKVFVTEFNNAAPQYTLDLSSIGGTSTMPIFVSHSVLEAMEGSTPIKQITMPAATNSTYPSITVQHQSSAVTGKAYITVRYIKLTSNNRSLSKGATDSLKADLSEVKDDGEEVTEKVEEPVEEPTEKEENER